VELLQVPLTDR